MRSNKFALAAFEALLDVSSEGMLIFDESLICQHAGRRAAQFFGTHPTVLQGRPRSEVLDRIAETCENLPDFWDRLREEVRSSSAIVLGELTCRSPQRTLVWRSAAILSSGTVVGRIDLLRDVTPEVTAEEARRALVERMQLLVPNDALTGLYNRRRFLDELEREHARAARAWDSYAIIRLDVDSMEAINENFGLADGDNALTKVATALGEGRRDYDMVARLANDEFGILLPGADETAAHAVIDRIQSALTEPSDISSLRLTVSVGAAIYLPPSTATASNMMFQAGKALAKARDGGPGTVVFFNPGETTQG